MKNTVLILNVMILIAIVICVLYTILFLIEKGVYIKIKQGFSDYVEEEEKQQIESLKRKFYVKTKKKFKYIEYLRLLITKSTINKKIKIITPVTVIVINILTSILFYTVSDKLIDVIPTNIVISIFGFIFPQLVLKILAIFKGNKVDKMLIDYMNLLINFLSIQDNVVYAIEHSVVNINEPLKTFSEQFIFEVKHGIPPYKALLSLGSKVENEQFKFMCKMLSLCNRTSGKYLLVTTKAKNLYIKTYGKDMDRKNEVLKNSMGLLGMVVLGIIGVKLLTLINPNLLYQLKTTSVGHVLITYLVFTFIVVILIAINSLKFDY